MLLDGLTIMLLGMGTVFIFLIALTSLISLLSVIFRSHASKEEARILGENAAKRRRKKEKQAGSLAVTSDKKPDEAITAVIAAALNMHRSRS